MQNERTEKNILKFGFTSFLTDISGDMVQSVLPLFMSAVLGMDNIFIGLVEGIAESTASLAKLVSGWLSDRLPKRKPSIITGYGLSTIAKPLLALAGSGPHVLAIRFADRLGKGIRTSPRDALLAESAKPDRRGLAFGFHRAMDSAGAIFGPAIASVFLTAGFSYRSIFLWAFLPAVLAVLILFMVKEPPGRKIPGSIMPEGIGKSTFPGRNFYLYLLSCALFTLGNSSDAFIILRAQNLGLGLALIPIIWTVQNTFYALVSTPAGYFSDRLGRKKIIFTGLSIYALVYAGLASANRIWHIWPLMVAYGLYYGITDGGFRSFVADMVPRENLGTAFGLYHAVTGISLLPASLLTGFLWESFGPKTAFLTGGVLALAAALLLIPVRIRS